VKIASLFIQKKGTSVAKAVLLR